MNIYPTAYWIAPFGERIEFQLYPYYGSWNEVGGIYLFCTWDAQRNVYVPAYIGETENFRRRFRDHEKWFPAIDMGAYLVLAAIVQPTIKRKFLEGLMISEYKPLLNTQLVGKNLADFFRK